MLFSWTIFSIRMWIVYVNYLICVCPQSEMSNIPVIYGRAGLAIAEPFAPNSLFLLSLYLFLPLSISLSIFHADISILSLLVFVSSAPASKSFQRFIFIDPYTSLRWLGAASENNAFPQYHGLCVFISAKKMLYCSAELEAERSYQWNWVDYAHALGKCM